MPTRGQFSRAKAHVARGHENEKKRLKNKARIVPVVGPAVAEHVANKRLEVSQMRGPGGRYSKLGGVLGETNTKIMTQMRGMKRPLVKPVVHKPMVVKTPAPAAPAIAPPTQTPTQLTPIAKPSGIVPRARLSSIIDRLQERASKVPVEEAVDIVNLGREKHHKKKRDVNLDDWNRVNKSPPFIAGVKTAMTRGEAEVDISATGLGQVSGGHVREDEQVVRRPGNQGKRGVPEWFQRLRQMTGVKTAGMTGFQKSLRGRSREDLIAMARRVRARMGAKMPSAHAFPKHSPQYPVYSAIKKAL